MRPVLSIVIVLLAVSHSALAQPVRVGVSWSNFQEERWKTDESALRDELERLGASYLSADAQSSSEKQIADVESLIARGIEVLILLAHDADAVAPALALARNEGIRVIAYDRLIEAPGIFYISFDNVEVGRLQARAIAEAAPRGRYAFIKGSPQDPNADFVHSGQIEELRAAIGRGDIEIVAEQYIDGWLPEIAQRVMEQILTAHGDAIDAVVCSNDAMAGGVLAALAGQGLEGIPVSGQDGDHAALNRVARGLQTVSVWKDARALGRTAARVAVALGRGTPPDEVEGATRWKDGPRRLDLRAILLDPIAITRERLGVVIDAGWISREAVCRNTAPAPPPACTSRRRQPNS